ncbi:MAG: tyrosine-type recombinase/integrase [Gammaproteobacteria bacterium]|jgi:integrase
MKTHFNFIKKTILALPTPNSGVVTYHDTTKRGLKILIRSTGVKTFVLYRKIKGKPERVTIGRFPDVSIEQARKQVDVLNAKIAAGVNPNEEKRAIRNEQILAGLFQQYMERHAKPHKKSWKEDESQFKRYLKPWAAKKISFITKTQIQKLHLKIRDEKGIYAANRLLALLSTVFNKAIEWGWKYPNPTNGIKKFKEKSRDRFIQGEELPRFFQALNDEPNETARDYILMSLLTGARKANVLAMRWEEISFTRSTWTIPETKTGESQTIPLVDLAIEILQHRKNHQDESPWVFPGTGKHGHYADPKKAWVRILERAEIKNLRIHDLRRSLGSWQAATGANLSIIGKTLGHKNTSTTAVYARLNLDPIRESMNKATDAMLEFLNNDDKINANKDAYEKNKFESD